MTIGKIQPWMKMYISYVKKLGDFQLAMFSLLQGTPFSTTTSFLLNETPRSGPWHVWADVCWPWIWVPWFCVWRWKDTPRIRHGFVRRLMVEYLQVEMIYVWNLRVCSCSKLMFEVRAYLKDQMFNSLSIIWDVFNLNVQMVSWKW